MKFTLNYACQRCSSTRLKMHTSIVHMGHSYPYMLGKGIKTHSDVHSTGMVKIFPSRLYQKFLWCVTTWACEIIPLFTHKRELMGDSPIWRQLSTKSQSREHLITVVVLDDLSHGLQGHGIGVHLVWVHVMQWSGLGWISFQDRRSQSQWCKAKETKTRLTCWETWASPGWGGCCESEEKTLLNVSGSIFSNTGSSHEQSKYDMQAWWGWWDVWMRAEGIDRQQSVDNAGWPISD